MPQANTSSFLCQNEAILSCDVCKNPLLLMEVAGASLFPFRWMTNPSHRFVLLYRVSYRILLSWCSTIFSQSISLICYNLFKIKYKFIEVEVLARTTTLFKFLDITTGMEGRKEKAADMKDLFCFLTRNIVKLITKFWMILVFCSQYYESSVCSLFCAFLWWPTLVTLYPKAVIHSYGESPPRI